ncbi:MAG: glycosyltransferase family 2 protein [Magnetococcales bacterium]|nr:glycosyltransferase family 2 protein [Magnetococcales bacterium]
MKVTLLIPTLNEIEGMKAIMPRIKPEWCDQILISDRSTDGTAEWAEAQGYQVYRQKKKGLRHAFIEAWPLITGDYVITFSPDGNSIPELIPNLIESLKEGHDMVIVSRYKDHAKSQDDDFITSFGNGLFNFVINMLYSYHYTDCMVMFRGYRTALFYELGLEKEQSYWQEKPCATVLGCEPLLSIRASKMGCRIAEIPGDEPPRIGSDRKLQIVRWGLGYMMQMFTEYFSKDYRAKPQ